MADELTDHGEEQKYDAREHQDGRDWCFLQRRKNTLHHASPVRYSPMTTSLIGAPLALGCYRAMKTASSAGVIGSAPLLVRTHEKIQGITLTRRPIIADEFERCRLDRALPGFASCDCLLRRLG